MSRLKVALCLSGEARTYDLAYEKFKKHILNIFDTDVFISTWDSDFLMTDKACSVENYISLYQPKAYEVEQLNKKNIPINRDITDVGELNYALNQYLTLQNQELFRGQKYLSAMEHNAGVRAYTMVNMFYKNWRCFHLALNYSEKHLIPYDIVIRSRPDLDFDQTLDPHTLNSLLGNKMRICVPSFGWGGKAVSDAYAYGSAQALYYYTNIFLMLEQYFYNGGVNMKPDFLLKTHLEAHGVEILTDNMTHGCLRPKYNLEKNLWYP